MGNPIRHSRGMLHKVKGDHLDSIYSEQKVLVMARQEAGPCPWELTLVTFSDDGEVRVVKQLLAAKKS